MIRTKRELGGLVTIECIIHTNSSSSHPNLNHPTAHHDQATTKYYYFNTYLHYLTRALQNSTTDIVHQILPFQDKSHRATRLLGSTRTAYKLTLHTPTHTHVHTHIGLRNYLTAGSSDKP